MKLIKTYLNLESRFLNKIHSNEYFAKSIVPIGILILLGELIWLAGPHITLYGYTPFTSAEKRVYVIISIFLAWIIKFLIIDLEVPTPLQYKDLKTRKKLQEIQNRFDGAVAFLKKTTVAKFSKSVRLHEIPWFLLIGPNGSGKTTLLANSDNNFVLQRQFQNTNLHNIPPTENCDWWVTREACIIDVPGKYLSTTNKKPSSKTIWSGVSLCN